jgi:integrase
MCETCVRTVLRDKNSSAVVDPDYTATVGLDQDRARALVAAADADADIFAQALRTAAVVRLLLHTALRVDEACSADIADLSEDSGHRVLRVVRKGARKAKVPLTPATLAALEAYLPDRAPRPAAPGDHAARAATQCPSSLAQINTHQMIPGRYWRGRTADRSTGQ